MSEQVANRGERPAGGDRSGGLPDALQAVALEGNGEATSSQSSEDSSRGGEERSTREDKRSRRQREAETSAPSNNKPTVGTRTVLLAGCTGAALVTILGGAIGTMSPVAGLIIAVAGVLAAVGFGAYVLRKQRSGTKSGGGDGSVRGGPKRDGRFGDRSGDGRSRRGRDDNGRNAAGQGAAGRLRNLLSRSGGGRDGGGSGRSGRGGSGSSGRGGSGSSGAGGGRGGGSGSGGTFRDKLRGMLPGGKSTSSGNGGSGKGAGRSGGGGSSSSGGGSGKGAGKLRNLLPGGKNKNTNDGRGGSGSSTSGARSTNGGSGKGSGSGSGAGHSGSGRVKGLLNGMLAGRSNRSGGGSSGSSGAGGGRGGGSNRSGGGSGSGGGRSGGGSSSSSGGWFRNLFGGDGSSKKNKNDGRGGSKSRDESAVTSAARSVGRGARWLNGKRKERKDRKHREDEEEPQGTSDSAGEPKPANGTHEKRKKDRQGKGKKSLAERAKDRWAGRHDDRPEGSQQGTRSLGLSKPNPSHPQSRNQTPTAGGRGKSSRRVAGMRRPGSTTEVATEKPQGNSQKNEKHGPEQTTDSTKNVTQEATSGGNQDVDQRTQQPADDDEQAPASPAGHGAADGASASPFGGPGPLPAWDAVDSGVAPAAAGGSGEGASAAMNNTGSSQGNALGREKRGDTQSTNANTNKEGPAMSNSEPSVADYLPQNPDEATPQVMAEGMRELASQHYTDYQRYTTLASRERARAADLQQLNNAGKYSQQIERCFAQADRYERDASNRLGRYGQALEAAEEYDNEVKTAS